MTKPNLPLHRQYSVLLSLIATILLAAEAFVPVLREHLPPAVLACIVGLIPIARAWPQDPDLTLEERVLVTLTKLGLNRAKPRGYASAYTMALAVVFAGVALVVRWLFALACVLAVSGCSVSLEQARKSPAVLGAASATAERCIALDNARTTWGAIAKGAAVVSGASGVSTIPLHEDQGAQIAMASTAAGAAALGAVAVYVAEQKGDAWARECASR